MRTLQFKLAGLLCLIFFFMVPNAFAQDITDALRLGLPYTSSDARALGMGDSYIGLSDGTGAAEFNPAGFGLLKKLEVSAGINYLSYNNNTNFLNQFSNYSNSATRLSNFSLAFPYPTTQGSLVFGLSYHSTQDYTAAMKFNGFNSGNNSLIQDLNTPLYISYDSNGNPTNIPFQLFLTGTNYSSQTGFNSIFSGQLNQSGTILQSGSTGNWTFSGAIEVYKNLFVGLNLNILSGSYENNYNYYEKDTHGIYYNQETSPGDTTTYGFQTFHMNNLLDWNLSGWDAKIGILYQLENHSRFGITVQFPKSYTVKETFNTQADAIFINNPTSTYSYNDQVQYDIVTPFELGAGFAFNIQSLVISAQATLIDYSQLKFDNADGIDAQTIASLNQSIKDNFRSVVNYNIGAEYTLPEIGLRLRAGFFVQPSAYQNDPSQYDRKYYTLGVGYLTDSALEIDLAYAHGWWNDYGYNYNDQYYVSPTTNQSITTNNFIVSTTFRF